MNRTEKSQAAWLETHIKAYEKSRLLLIGLSDDYANFLATEGSDLLQIHGHLTAEEMLRKLKFPEGKYWTYQIGNNDECETEYPTLEEAEAAATISFNQSCSEGDDYKDAQEAEVIYRYAISDDDGDVVILGVENGTLEYEYESDDSEHSTMNRSDQGV